MKRFGLVALLMSAVALAIVVVLLDRPPGPTSDPGTASLESFFRSYVDALNANDPNELGRILGEAPGSTEVRARLDRYGARGIGALNVSAVSDFPQVYQVKLSGTYGDGSKFMAADVVEWTGTRWHMAPLPPLASGGGSAQP